MFVGITLVGCTNDWDKKHAEWYDFVVIIYQRIFIRKRSKYVLWVLVEILIEMGIQIFFKEFNFK